MKTKKLFFSFAIGLLSCIASAQVTVAINVSVAGSLGTALSAAGGNKSTVTNLKIKGNIDTRDFKFMRDSMPILAILDLDSVRVKSYKGNDGTYGTFDPIATISANIFAQASAMVNVATAGGLSAAIVSGGGNANTITNLTVTGNIDARDVKFMRDSMPVLAIINIQTVSIIAYTGSVGTISGTTIYPANKMPDNSFCIINLTGANQSKLTLNTIILPNGITSIGKNAFSGCTGLKDSLIIPAGVKTIEDYAFGNCSGLTGTLSIPNSVITIGPGAFSNCSRLTGTLNIPSLVTTIGHDAFYSCSGFKGNLVIPNSVTSIGNFAFGVLSGIKGTLKLSNSITAIPDNAFEYSLFTGKLVLPSSIKTFGNESFGFCTGFTGDLVIPSSTTSINSSFVGCAGIISCFIPSSVTDLTGGAFTGCSGLQKIVVNKTSPLTILESTLNGINKTTCTLIVPVGSKSAYQAATGWKLFTNITEAIIVLLNTQGGDLMMPITTSANTTITVPEMPLKQDYTFAGWYKEVACINAWDFATDVVTTTFTLYAKWTSNPTNSYTVTFNVNGGSTVADIVVTNNATIAAPTPPVKPGYIFVGWYKEPGCINAWNFATDVVSANVTLYAKWTLINGINNQLQADFKIYPNPVKDKLYINFNSFAASGAIFDLQGKRVLEVMAGTNQVDISNLSKGIYFVTFFISGNMITYKLIKE